MKQGLRHQIFGTLKWDSGLEWYAGTIDLDGLEAAIYISVDEADDEASLFSRWGSIYPSLPNHVVAAREFASTELLSLKNGEWLGEGEEQLTATDFASRLIPESLTLYPDMTSEVIFHAGGMFFGHVVLISLDASGQCSDATIAG